MHQGEFSGVLDQIDTHISSRRVFISRRGESIPTFDVQSEATDCADIAEHTRRFGELQMGELTKADRGGAIDHDTLAKVAVAYGLSAFFDLSIAAHHAQHRSGCLTLHLFASATNGGKAYAHLQPARNRLRCDESHRRRAERRWVFFENYAQTAFEMADRIVKLQGLAATDGQPIQRGELGDDVKLLREAVLRLNDLIDADGNITPPPMDWNVKTHAVHANGQFWHPPVVQAPKARRRERQA